MDGATIALILLVPAAALFLYSGWSEYRRYRQDGPSNYGLTYDPETNTTHVGPLPEGEDSFDPEDFTPDAETGAEPAEADDNDTDGAPRDDKDHDDRDRTDGTQTETSEQDKQR